VPPPEGVKFEFKATVRLKDELNKIRSEGGVLGHLLSGQTFQEVATRAYRILDLKGDPSWEAMLRTMSPFYGMEYDERAHEDLTWRLAAGRSWLEAGIHIEPKFVAAQPYWTSLIIEDCQYLPRFKDREDRVRVYMRVLGGRFAGHQLIQVWSHKYHTRFVAKEIGFPIYEPVHYRELTQTWFVGLLDSENPKRAVITEIFGSSGAVAHNRKLREGRVNGCPWKHEWMCHQCHRGYEGTDGCIHAAHKHTFVQRACSRCKNTEAWFDPASDMPICVSCLARERRRAGMGG
jgi:hypothetical protein